MHYKGCTASKRHLLQFTFAGMIDLVLWRMKSVKRVDRIPLIYDAKSMVATYKQALLRHLLDDGSSHPVECPWPGCRDLRASTLRRDCMLFHLQTYQELQQAALHRPKCGDLAGYECTNFRETSQPERAAGSASRGRRLRLDDAARPRLPADQIWVAGVPASTLTLPQLADHARRIYPHYTTLEREHWEWEAANLLEADHAHWFHSCRTPVKAIGRLVVAAWYERLAHAQQRHQGARALWRTGEVAGRWSLQRKFRDAHPSLVAVEFGAVRPGASAAHREKLAASNRRLAPALASLVDSRASALEVARLLLDVDVVAPKEVIEPVCTPVLRAPL
jgi:hypothetical protein